MTTKARNDVNHEDSFVSFVTSWQREDQHPATYTAKAAEYANDPI